ncbi:MAG TPA: LysR family transcriptional regulator [Paracoccus sp. (in: a-proteobacteria)]|uniref:LysR family transcriptional regulator n=1 Tax=Paracoccus sp. TaxID=267 RepID=UPI002BF7903F|nr:LysR family transcriptional regulator [Paracoccus sp. (in: a-proteobacteria)]HWL57100.1 LysR family transcriptional regulator [Paracoccus sp. (in: a-proteobacteria)]
MDRIEAMRVFARVAERRSFTLAAEDLGLPRSTVTDAVRHLERRLGVRLLERTTRVVRPTLDGEAYYQRCLRIISDIEDAEAAFSGAKPSGQLRVDLHGTEARHFLIPGLPEFLSRYPELHLHITERHEPLDLLREGYDCIVRAGQLGDSTLISRKLAELERGTFASPDYLARHGTPRRVEDLTHGHRMVGLLAPDSPTVAPFSFDCEGRIHEMTLPSVITITGAETNIASACASLGLVQVPRYRVERELTQGALVEVLPDNPPRPLPVHALYLHTHQLSPRLRVFLDWLSAQYRNTARPVPGGPDKPQRLPGTGPRLTPPCG